LNQVDELRSMIADAHSIVAFTGAGISTESGIPDFRSPGGIWTKYRPIEFSDFLASAESRRESWRRKRITDEAMLKATPNAGHRALARLYETGKLLGIVTQNIDGLHEASGIPGECIAELHGNSTYAACLDCRQRHELAWVWEVFSDHERLPLCTACGGVVKTATISFGQAMPQEAMAHAHDLTCAADLFIALGSSLVVYPAAGFPVLAKRNGAKLVIVNRDPTDLDELADLVINAEIGATLSKAVGVN
jgi:NAD-dependent deacetylase